jgi:hypothetical protein
MSQSVELVLVIASVDALREVIRELGSLWQREKTLSTADGRTHDVDYVATDADGTRVGVRVDARSGRAVLVSEGCGSKAQAFASRIAQRYAYARVTDELRRKGYQIGAEERGRDGSVRLVATRWA